MNKLASVAVLAFIGLAVANPVKDNKGWLDCTPTDSWTEVLNYQNDSGEDVTLDWGRRLGAA